MKSYTLTLPPNYTPPPFPGRDLLLIALRSGEYIQGQRALERLDGSKCCLGVLCAIQGRLQQGDDGLFGSSQTLAEDNPSTPFINFEGMFPNGVVFINDYRSYLNHLSVINDTGYTFHQIADIIEKVWSNAPKNW